TMRHVAAIIAGTLACLVLTGSAQQPATPGQQPTFRAGVDVIRLDVSVLDKNRQPIRGLTAADFTILENGKPQRIVALSQVAAVDRFEPRQQEWVGNTPMGPGARAGDLVQQFAPSMARSRCARAQPAIPALDTVVARLATVPNRRKTLILVSPGVPFAFNA